MIYELLDGHAIVDVLVPRLLCVAGASAKPNDVLGRREYLASFVLDSILA
jgi:hypothetical protein